MGSSPLVGLAAQGYKTGLSGTEGNDKMPKRREDATIELKVRMKEPLRRQIEHAAKDRGISMNAEAVSRLERSFDAANLVREAVDHALGGPDLRGMALSMITAFASAGQRSAGADVPPRQWMQQPDAYRAAVVGVLDALLKEMPEASDEQTALMIESLKGRLLTRILNRPAGPQ